MNIKITDGQYVHGKSGIGLRFTLNLAARHPEYGIVQQSTKGCLAFRNRKEEINVLTPVIYLGPAKVKYKPIVLNPAFASYLQAELEKQYGSFLKRDTTKDHVSTGVGVARYGMPEELDLGGEL